MNLLRKINELFFDKINSRAKRKFLSFFLFHYSSKRYEMKRNVRFLDYQFNVPDMKSFIWQLKEIFVDEKYKIKLTNKNPVIYDCGSNIGTGLIYFASHYPTARIIGFEADEKISDISLENLKQNNIHNVEVMNSAVWVDYNGIDFSVEGADGGSINGSDNIVKVKTIRLKDFLEKENGIDLLKIDIEGAENKVIEDCKDSLENVSNIFIEYHSWNNSKQDLSSILNVLEQNNYRYFIEDLVKKRSPFVKKERTGTMDLQLNIFAYR